MRSDETHLVTCPYCGEEVEIYLEPEVRGSLIQDCEVCCNPWQVTVWWEDGERYVDVRRVAAHGHSMGAFVTTAFAAAYPADVRVASHTSGGVLLDAIHLEGMPFPSVAQARRIQAPYQWHHGLLDYAVPFLLARRFDSVITAPHEGHLYSRLRHAAVATDPEVLSRVRAWYTTHGIF